MSCGRGNLQIATQVLSQWEEAGCVFILTEDLQLHQQDMVRGFSREKLEKTRSLTCQQIESLIISDITVLNLNLHGKDHYAINNPYHFKIFVYLLFQ